MASRSSSTLSWIAAIDSMFVASSAWNTTISSIRFRNSGRKCCFTSSQTASFIASCGSPTIDWITRRTEVRGHHDHRVLEVHGAALAVGHAAVVEHLQQHVEHVRMRLLDLVEQDHAIRLATHGLGQIAALLVADVARRRADQARDRVLLHELAHVDADQVIFGVEQERRQRLAQLGLADAGRAEEQERTVRPVRVRQTRARTADRIGHRADRLVLADHALRAACPRSAAACRARPASCATPECRWNATRLRRFPRRRPACAAARGTRRTCSCSFASALSLPSARFSRPGSLPYCNSATFLKLPLRVATRRSPHASSRSLPSVCALPCTAAFSACPDFVEVAIFAFCSSISSSISAGASATLRPSPS